MSSVYPSLDHFCISAHHMHFGTDTNSLVLLGWYPNSRHFVYALLKATLHTIPSGGWNCTISNSKFQCRSGESGTNRKNLYLTVRNRSSISTIQLLFIYERFQFPPYNHFKNLSQDVITFFIQIQSGIVCDDKNADYFQPGSAGSNKNNLSNQFLFILCCSGRSVFLVWIW